jgi:hypothetical protein
MCGREMYADLKFAEQIWKKIHPEKVIWKNFLPNSRRSGHILNIPQVSKSA